MHPLDDARRRRLFTLSVVLCAIPLCLAPLAGRSSFELASERAAFNARFTTPEIQNVWDDRPVSVVRDPFVPERTIRSASVDILHAGDVMGMHVTQGQPMGFVLPANRGAAETPLQRDEFGLPAVTALVTGPSSRALVDDGQHVRVVEIGQMLEGSRITAIDAAGVHLQNGTVLSLTTEDHR